MLKPRLNLTVPRVHPSSAPRSASKGPCRKWLRPGPNLARREFRLEMPQANPGNLNNSNRVLIQNRFSRQNPLWVKEFSKHKGLVVFWGLQGTLAPDHEASNRRYAGTMRPCCQISCKPTQQMHAQTPGDVHRIDPWFAAQQIMYCQNKVVKRPNLVTGFICRGCIP